ncbi:MAG: molybdopterin dinucleotide binding domain-containing protein [Myxococcota bacterium]
MPLDEVRRHPAGAVFDDPPVFVAPKDRRRLGASRRRQRRDDGGARARRAGRDDARRRRRASPSAGLPSPAERAASTPWAATSPVSSAGVQANPAHLHPDDLAALGLAEGDLVEIRSGRARILGVVAADATLAPGARVDDP